jgi:hypothetical protein
MHRSLLKMLKLTKFIASSEIAELIDTWFMRKRYGMATGRAASRNAFALSCRVVPRPRRAHLLSGRYLLKVLKLVTLSFFILHINSCIFTYIGEKTSRVTLSTR